MLVEQVSKHYEFLLKTMSGASLAEHHLHLSYLSKCSRVKNEVGFDVICIIKDFGNELKTEELR